MRGIWRSLIVSSLLGAGVIVFLYLSETGTMPSLQNDWPWLLTALLIIDLSSLALYATSRSLNKRFSWREQINLRFLLEVSAGVVYIAIGAGLFALLLHTFLPETGDETTFWDEYWEGAIKLGILTVVITYLYSLVHFSLYSYNQYAKHQLQQYQAARTQLTLQFDALRSQLSPHFLFNALNTVSSLIYRNAEIASDYIRQLVFTYRYILRTNSFQLIPLNEELELVKAFYFMQQIKYEDRFEYKQDLSDAAINSWIPPLTLQMLMENALKHNVVNEEKKLTLEISDQNGFLLVKNNLLPRTQLLRIGNNLVERPDETASYKIGLTNIRDRYAYFTSKQIEVSKNAQFIVKLPLIRQKEKNEALL
jgi:hypothetical protein